MTFRRVATLTTEIILTGASVGMLGIDLASEKEYFRHSSEPGYLESLLEGAQVCRVLIDEIQRIPSLLNTVQYWTDQQKRSLKTHKKTQFLLSGTSARKLKWGEANLAPGRILSFEMGGLAASELDYRLDCHRALSFGFLPEPCLLKNKKEAFPPLDL